MSTATLDRPAVLDETAFTALWSEHAAITRYIARHVPHNEAADLADETFTRAWAGRHTYRPGAGSPTGWLYAIAGRVVADHYRTAGRRVHTVGIWPDHDDADHTDVAADTVSDAAVAELLAALPERQRLVLIRRILQDQPVAAVAAELDCTQGTVKSLAHRALVALRALLAPAPEPVAVEPAPEPVVAPVTPPAPEPRSPHAVTPTRPRCARGSRRPSGCARPTGRGPLRQRPVGRPGAAAAGGIQALVSRHPFHRPDLTGCGRHGAAAEAVGGGLGPPGSGTPGDRRHRARAAAGRLVTAAQMWATILLAAAFAAVAAVGWLWASRDPQSRRDSRAAFDELHQLNERRQKEIGTLAIFQRTPVGADLVATAAAPPTVPGIEFERTQRLEPKPIPQDVVDHVELWRQANTGRHWAGEQS